MWAALPHRGWPPLSDTVPMTRRNGTSSVAAAHVAAGAVANLMRVGGL